MIKLPKFILVRLEEEAARCYPNEACGLLYKAGRRKIDIAFCTNVADEATQRFVIQAQDFAAAEDRGEVIGVWHSHVEHSSTPSEVDIHACNASGLHWIISDIYRDGEGFRFGEMSYIAPSDESMDYTGRPYIYGVNDCFTLIIDYYRKEFGIDIDPRKITGYPEILNWDRKDIDFFSEQNFTLYGFVKLIDAEPEIGDAFLIQMSSHLPNHVAIYVGDNKILHHYMNRLSCVDIYGGYWRKHTSAHLRHKDKLNNVDHSNS